MNDTVRSVTSPAGNTSASSETSDTNGAMTQLAAGNWVNVVML